MLSEITDGDGNLLYWRGHEIFLKLSSGGRTRKLGEVQGETLHTYRDLRKHEMRNYLEVGFNWHLIRFGVFRYVVVHTQEGAEYHTSRKWILRNGRINKPGRRKFELQIFLKLSDFKGFIEPEEKPLPPPPEPAQESFSFVHNVS
jgi:hypothetical protein